MRDWNTLLESVVSSAVIADDCVAKFISQVGTSDQFHHATGPSIKVINTSVHSQTQNKAQ